MPARRPRLPAASLVDYGVIGDLHTAGLVSKDGGLDWLCLPRFDSGSVFAALLDDERGGRMRIAPTGEYRSSQSYVPDTNILRTEFACEGGRAVLTTFMPVEEWDAEEYADHEVHCIIEVVQGRVKGELEFMPRFNYGLALTRLEERTGGVLARATGQAVVLASDLPLRIEEDAAYAEWDLSAGASARAVLRYDTALARPVADYATEAKRERTERFWRSWSGRCTYSGRWADAVRRSALALKLLTYAPTGALVAAATTSLPEAPKGERNWDYRYSWVRDSAFAMQVFHAVGYTREARRYLRWLRRVLRGLTTDIGQLRVCYGVEGETEAPEMELGHLAGYLGSRPVRIGNEAIRQFQLDTFGSLASAIHDAYHRPEGFPDEAWRTLRALADHIVEHWMEPDHGIWEVRGARQHYTHSLLTCWVALDRALRVAKSRGHPGYNDRWGPACEAIRKAILERGYNPRVGSFVMVLDGEHLDASLLLIPLVGFLPPDDPRVRSTIDAIDRTLGSGPFVHRYRAPDGLQGDEGAFLMCSFWMVHALALVGRLDEAQSRFDALVRLAGPLGLFSEEVEVSTGKSLGNFPQALTHLSHVNAALALDAALKQRAAAKPPDVVKVSGPV